MAQDWGKKLGRGLLKAGKTAAKMAAEQKAAMDERQLAQLRERIRAKLSAAETYRDDAKVAAALDAFPPDWSELDLASTGQLSRSKHMIALESAVDTAKAAADRAARAADAERKRRARIESIPSLFADKSNELSLSIAEMHIRTQGQNETAQAAWAMAIRGVPRQLEFVRLVADLKSVERNLLKAWMLLHAHGVISDFQYYALYIPVIYNDGECRRYAPEGEELLGANWERFKEHMERTCMRAGEAWDRMRADILDSERTTDDPTMKEILRDVLYGGNSWMRAGEIPQTGLFVSKRTPTSLMIGPTDKEEADEEVIVREDGEGSLLTLAPPGSGKTQSHVIPNLVTYEGPMIVLDIKGECYRKTAGWRSQVVGPVLRFAPEEDSAAYNPLEFIPRGNPIETYEGSLLLARQLIIPSGKGDNSYWENEAQALVAGLIAFVVLEEPNPNLQNMGTVMDLLSPTRDALENMTEIMQASSIRPLRNLGNQLVSMSESAEKALEGIFSTARSHLTVWSTGRLDPITNHSDWSPMDFRGPERPTLYLCIPLGTVKTYAPVLRVIIAQHIAALTQQNLARPDVPIVMMLDEFPQLGQFEPAVQALEVGRSAGLKLWIIAQDEDQLRQRYGSPDAILNKCTVRLFMDPPETTAYGLSRALGYREGLLDGEREPLAMPNDLTGPEFRDNVIVLARGCKPLKLKKWFAHEIDFIRTRLDLPVHAWPAGDSSDAKTA